MLRPSRLLQRFLPVRGGAPSVLIMGNVSQKPYCNNLLPIVNAWRAAADVRVVEPAEVEGFVPTYGARPAPVPAAAFDRLDTGWQPGIVVCIAGGLYLPDETRNRLPSSVVTVGLALSDPLGLEASLDIAPQFDLFYSQDPHTFPYYAARGIEVGLVAPAVDSDLYRPLDIDEDCDVIFVGKWTAHRDELVGALAERCRVKVFTRSGEERWSVPVEPPLEEPSALNVGYSRARLALEVALVEQEGNPLDGTCRITNRPQFAAAAGTPSLIEPYDELERFFEVGTEIEAYADAKDLVEKACALLEDDDRRRQMARLARERVVRDHSWHSRVRMILDDAGALQRRRPSG